MTTHRKKLIEVALPLDAIDKEKRLDEEGERSAARLLSRLGSTAEHAKSLAYRLYTTCERKGLAEEAQAYNGLVPAWPELEKLAGEAQAGIVLDDQPGLFE